MTRRLLGLFVGLLMVVPAFGIALPASAQEAPAPPPVPEASGEGRRVVYSNGQQRVWLVEADGSIARTYLVSGRRNYPRRGTFAVFSKSEWSRSGSLRLQYMVRFTRSARTNVGFHAIPIDRRGRMIQSVAQLGTPRSRGCVREAPEDAKFLWDWTVIGTIVTVVP